MSVASRTGLGLVMLLTLAACQHECDVDVSRSGDIVTFTATMDRNPSTCINQVVVTQVDGPLMWIAKRHPNARCVNQFEFGVTPAGYENTMIGAVVRPLVAGKTYRVEVTGEEAACVRDFLYEEGTPSAP